MHRLRSFGLVWKALKGESTFHQLSPYIGKLKSSIARSLVSQFTEASDTFTILFQVRHGCLEAWSQGAT